VTPVQLEASGRKRALKRAAPPSQPGDGYRVGDEEGASLGAKDGVRVVGIGEGATTGDAVGVPGTTVGKGNGCVVGPDVEGRALGQRNIAHT
jgi:hypothetical protein